MNKLRLIRIFELRGKIHPIEQCLIELLDGIEKVPYSNVYIRYWKDDILYFEKYLNSNNIYLDHTCYKNLDNFGCSKEETIVVLKYLLEKHLKITINGVY